MADPFIGEIRIFSGNFAPRDWAFCNGQTIPVAQNPALFSIVGTIYGGDGRTTFGVPDLQGRAPMHAGSGPGLTPRPMGQELGANETTLAVGNLPVHSHTMSVVGDQANQNTPASGLSYAATPGRARRGASHYGPPNNLGSMANGVMGATGGGQPHNNMQPFLAINFIIALTGIYPSRP